MTKARPEPDGLGLEGYWMPGQNIQGNLFHVAIKLGLGGGIVSPKMNLMLRRAQ